jgi:hypothetical protein
MNKTPRLLPSGLQAAGFTLIELLVAAALTILVLAILLTSVNEGSRIWLSSLDGRDQGVRTRAMMQTMVEDIRRASLDANFQQRRLEWTTNTNTVPRLPVTDSWPQFFLNLSSPVAADQNPGAIFMFSPLSGGRAQGLNGVSGYFVKWPTNGPGVPAMGRFFTSAYPRDTNVPSFTKHPASTIAPSAWQLSKEDIDAVAPVYSTNSNSLGVFAANGRGALVDGVIALWVRALDPVGNPLTLDANGTATGYGFDSRLGYRYTNASATITVPPPALPPAVEICVLAVAGASAQRASDIFFDGGVLNPVFTNYGANSPVNFDQEITNYIGQLPEAVRRDVRQYRTIVRLPNAR